MPGAVGLLVTALSIGGVLVATRLPVERLEVQREWYAPGQLRTERSYVDGREHGVHRGWYPDGSPMFERTFRNGLAEGVQREWYLDGKPFTEFTYVHGQESGRQRMWTEYGSLRANYVVEGGRRFGLMGSTGCEGEVHDSLGRSP